MFKLSSFKTVEKYVNLKPTSNESVYKTVYFIVNQTLKSKFYRQSYRFLLVMFTLIGFLEILQSLKTTE